MPVQKSKSALAAKIGEKGRKSHEAHKAEPPKTGGGGDLPGGITGGVARLTKCGFSEYGTGDNKGQPFFMAMGVVVEPTEYAGRHTKVGPIGLCDTKNSEGKVTPFDDNYAKMLNEFKLLGIKTETIGFDDLENVASALETEGPHFRFNTSEGKPTEKYPTPKVWENWRGRCEYNGEVQSGVEDNSGDGSVPVKEEDLPFGDGLDMLAQDAEKGDKAAQTTIGERAEAAGVAEESGKASTWEASVEIIREAEKSAGNGEAASEDASEEPTKPDPVKKEMYYYKSARNKTETAKQYNSRKAVEVEVLSVDQKARTVKLRDVDTQKEIKEAVDFDDLQDEA
jgi:hypothetical protein